MRRQARADGGNCLFAASLGAQVSIAVSGIDSTHDMEVVMRIAKSRRAAIVSAVVALLGMAFPLSGQGTTDVKQQSRELSTVDVAAQLGLRAAPSQPAELNVGSSATFALMDPSKLAALGMSGLHVGSRVTIIRMGADKLRVEVDEIDPVVVTRKATLKLGPDGKLSAIPS